MVGFFVCFGLAWLGLVWFGTYNLLSHLITYLLPAQLPKNMLTELNTNIKRTGQLSSFFILDFYRVSYSKEIQCNVPA